MPKETYLVYNGDDEEDVEDLDKEEDYGEI